MRTFAALSDWLVAAGRGLALAALLVAVGIGEPARADAEGDWHAGFAAGERGDHELALRYYSRAIHAGWLPPEKMAQVFYNRGTAYLRLGDLDWAIQDYSVAIWLVPDFAEAFYNRGVAHRQRGEPERAREDFARARSLTEGPDVPAARAGEPELALDPTAEPPPTVVAARPVDDAPKAPPPRAPTTSDATGGYALQLASMRTMAGARRDWRRLQGLFPDLFGDREFMVRRVELPELGVFYRVVTGAYPDRAAATVACAALKAREQDCLPLALEQSRAAAPPTE